MHNVAKIPFHREFCAAGWVTTCPPPVGHFVDDELPTAEEAALLAGRDTSAGDISKGSISWSFRDGGRSPPSAPGSEDLELLQPKLIKITPIDREAQRRYHVALSQTALGDRVPIVAMTHTLVQARKSRKVKLRASIVFDNPNGRFRRGFAEWYPKDVIVEHGVIRFYMIAFDSSVDQFFAAGEIMTTLSNTRGLHIGVFHRGESYVRDALSPNFVTCCPKWRQGTPEASVRTSLQGVTALVKDPCSIQSKMVAATDRSLQKTRYMLACGLAQCSVHLGVHPIAKLNFNHPSPGDSYQVPFIKRRMLYDNGECVYNAIGLTVYGEDMQPRVRKDCNDWLEASATVGAQGGLHATGEEVSVPISFLQELQSLREIWDLRTDDEIR